MSRKNLKQMVSEKLVEATLRIKEDYNSLVDFEKLLKTPNLSTIQLKRIEESLANIESHLRNFSYKSISQSNKELFLTDLKEEFFDYINERNQLQSKLLSIQNKVDTRLLIHSRRSKEKNMVLSENLIEIQSKLKLLLNDIRFFDLNLPFTQLLEHYKLINRNMNKILNELAQDNFNLFKEGDNYKKTIFSLNDVKKEFSQLKTSLTKVRIPISDMVRIIESLKLTYIDKIPLYEIYESFNPINKEEIDSRLNEAISEPQYFPNMNMKLDKKNVDQPYLIFSLKEDKKVEEKEFTITAERRYEIFKRVLTKFDSIKISQLAGLLGMKNETEVLEYILEIPDEFGFKIQEDTLIIEQHEVLEHIDALVSMFEAGVGKESKI